MSSAFGGNTAQIEALYEHLALLDAHAWLLLAFAESGFADPSALKGLASTLPQLTADLRRVRANIINQTRIRAMSTGLWPEIEESVMAANSTSLRLAFDVASRVDPDATGEALAERALEYSGAIGGLTQALILRPFVTPIEFEALWTPYEDFCPELRAIRRLLPEPTTWQAPSTLVFPPTTGDAFGGVLVYLVGLPLLFGLLAMIALYLLDGLIPTRDAAGAIAEPFRWIAGALVIIADAFIFWWAKVRPKRD